ncbi:MAG TPA: HAD family hydrolase [Candidatus Limnocylindria bacterium]
MPLRAILFDLDNTLLLEDEAVARALQQTSELACRRAGVDAGLIRRAAQEAAATLFRSAHVFAYADSMGIWWGEALWGDFSGEQSGLAALRAFVPGFRQEVWAHALEAAAISDRALVDELAAAYPTFRRASQPIDPEAEATLDDLGHDHQLALVTNGAPDVQRAKLARTTLASRFAAIVISAEVGAGKPDPKIFHAALDALDVASTDAVMVGDSLERDIAGARGAGLRGVWLDRSGTALTGDVMPDARIRSLRDLRDSLIGLERVGAFAQRA